MLFQDPYPINPVEAAQVLETVLMIQLSFCIRWGVRPEMDYEKLRILESNLQIRDKTKASTAKYRCMVQMKDNQEVGKDAYKRLPPQFHEAVFTACARIVALKGFDEDMRRLAELKTNLKIDDYRAEMIIEIAKNEAELIRLGSGY